MRRCRVSAAGARRGREVRARPLGSALGMGRDGSGRDGSRPVPGWLSRPLPRARGCAVPPPLQCPRHCSPAAPELRFLSTRGCPRGARRRRHAAPRSVHPLAALCSDRFTYEPRAEEPSLRRGGAGCRGAAGILNRSAFSQSPERGVVADTESCRAAGAGGGGQRRGTRGGDLRRQRCRLLSRQGPSGGLSALWAPPPLFPPARRPGPSCVRDGAGRAAGRDPFRGRRMLCQQGAAGRLRPIALCGRWREIVSHCRNRSETFSLARCFPRRSAALPAGCPARRFGRFLRRGQRGAAGTARPWGAAWERSVRGCASPGGSAGLGRPGRARAESLPCRQLRRRCGK